MINLVAAQQKKVQAVFVDAGGNVVVPAESVTATWSVTGPVTLSDVPGDKWSKILTSTGVVGSGQVTCIYGVNTPQQVNVVESYAVVAGPAATGSFVVTPVV